MSKFDELVKKLKEIFQIDKPELDFGVYRILNARAGEISDFLEKGLKAKVFESLQTAGAANGEAITRELKEKEAQLRDLGVNPDTAPKIIELRQRLNSLTGGASEHENATYSHLLTFFSRYYDNGDFISQRRYKGDTYAIPYSGEEVMLHWANKDQYYTKSGESFSNYAFKLEDGRSVVFRLLAADTAKDNRKDNDKERRFVLIKPHTRILHDEEGEEFEQGYVPLQEVNGELVIYFDYKAVQKGTKQEDLVAKTVKTILEDEAVKTRWLALSTREPTEKNPNRTLLEKALTGYTTKNTADYFIHKDLGGFLRRELDFYIKNEVTNLDDVSRAEKFADIEKNLRLIQTLRAIAQELIIFLVQLEDFQKKLWLKKKFVVATHYCFTLDHVPETLMPTIVENERQWQQWVSLGMLEKSVDKTLVTLKNHRFLMVDTALFDASFKADLLFSIQNLDDKLDGLLIHGDNFQALNLLQTRYREQVKCIHIDPPYNAATSGFLYKNGYTHSSWNSMIYDRIHISQNLLSSKGSFQCHIDENEYENLFNLSKQMRFEFVTSAIWDKRNPMNGGQGLEVVWQIETS